MASPRGTHFYIDLYTEAMKKSTCLKPHPLPFGLGKMVRHCHCAEKYILICFGYDLSDTQDGL